MTLRYFLTLTVTAAFILGLGITALAQTRIPGCIDLKNGTFHAYPRNSPFHYMIHRQGDIEIDVNLTHNDSSVWKVEWKDYCSYVVTYLSGNEPVSDEMAKFLRKHELAYRITSTTIDYFTYEEYVDKPGGALLETDTAWFKEKEGPPAVPLFVVLPDNGEQILRKKHFSDTSQYAILYVYRPGKVALSLSPYVAYLGGNFLCTLKNRSGYVFVIFMEGPVTIQTKLADDAVSLPVDIKFGKRYYIRSTIAWGMYRGLHNSKLELAFVDATKGRKSLGRRTGIDYIVSLC